MRPQYHTNMSNREYDLFTFIAEDALRCGRPFFVTCNCGTKVHTTPPFKSEFVVCPQCLATIKLLVIEGDPGYIIIKNPTTGEPDLAAVQGSTAKTPDQLTPQERADILAKAKEQIRKQQGHGDTK